MNCVARAMKRASAVPSVCNLAKKALFAASDWDVPQKARLNRATNPSSIAVPSDSESHQQWAVAFANDYLGFAVAGGSVAASVAPVRSTRNSTRARRNAR